MSAATNVRMSRRAVRAIDLALVAGLAGLGIFLAWEPLIGVVGLLALVGGAMLDP